MTRIVVLGASGQVGFELLAHLAPLGEVVAATRDGELPGAVACAQANVAVPGSAAALIARERPQVVVNAAAYTAVDRAEDEPDQALRANGLALAEIGAAAREVGATVVHYSTDYVFPGDGTRPYREDDATGPRSAYGESKLAGERALADSGADHLIFRTAWVYAARGQNFLRTMLRLGRERDQLKVVDDQRGAPTPAPLIAAITAQVVARWLGADARGRAALSGVTHLASAGETTWCGFARAIFERAAAAGLVERAPQVVAIASHEFPAKAARPAYSVLDCGRLRERTGLHLPDWRQGLDRVIADLADRRGA
jgi:dTDP-4-dehydrorhamnose reductase